MPMVSENEDSKLNEALKEDSDEKYPTPEETAGEHAEGKEKGRGEKEKGGEGEEKGGEGEEKEEEGENKEGEEKVEEKVEGQEKVESEERVEGEEKLEGEEKVEEEEKVGEEGEKVEGEHFEGEESKEKGEHVEEEYVKDEEKGRTKDEQKEYGEVEGEQVEGEVPEEQEVEKAEEELVEEEPEYAEEPVDPAAPLNLTESKEALRTDFELRQDQLAQAEKVWALYQHYTPAYSDIDGYITIKELVYMLKCLFLMTYTEEQLMELIDFCVRPKDEKGHISYEQFLHMVKIRWRDLETEDELRSALQFYDPQKTGEVDANELREVLGKFGNKLSSRIIEEFIKEIDISGEGKIGIEDVVAIVGMDLMKDEVIAPKSDEEEF